MEYGLSNGLVTDDVTWPWKVKLVTPIWLERNLENYTWARDFKFGMQLCMGNTERAHKSGRVLDLYSIWHTIKHICGQNNVMLTRIVVRYMQSRNMPMWQHGVSYGSTICYLATIAITRVCCVAVRSAILATAWLLVIHMFCTLFESGRYDCLW